MSLPDPLPIQPFTRPVRGAVTLPGSKSLTNRALFVAALCDGPVTLTGALLSEDTEIMAEALRKLGFSVQEDPGSRSITIVGQGGKIPAERAELFVGNAGTAARFLTALCAAAPSGVFRIDGVPQMRKRPMKGLIDALRSMGAVIRCLGEEGHFPLEIAAHGLSGGLVKIDASESSQMLSGLLMAAPLAAGDISIKLAGRVREPFVEMTQTLMHHFGVEIGALHEVDGGPQVGFHVIPSRYFLAGPLDIASNSKIYPIEPDATAASYFLALPRVTTGTISVGHLGNALQGDIKFADVLAQLGLSIAKSPQLRAGYRRQGIAGAGTGSAGGSPAPEFNFNEFSDTFLTLAAIAPLLEGPTRISGIAHTRKQETDRVAGMARELKRLGQDVGETADRLEIRPLPLPRADRPIEIETYRDHRFAMSFAILGCHDLRGDGRPWLAIRDPGCCAKTFPNFFDVLESLRQKSLQDQ